MAPLRSAPNAKIHPQTNRHRKSSQVQSSDRQNDSSSLPGVQKIKSSIRQTRRLLAKEKLAADVRIQTERRLEVLEKELQIAERRRKERTLAVRYHKVKFFERRKAIRKILQKKKQMASIKESKKRLTDLENELYELRVDLNYVLHYPKLEKYISLYAASDENSFSSDSESKAMKSNTDLKREEIRAWIRTKMEQGELSIEPEIEVQNNDVRVKQSAFVSDSQRDKNHSKARHKDFTMTDHTENDVHDAPDPLEEDDFFDVDDTGMDDMSPATDSEDDSE